MLKGNSESWKSSSHFFWLFAYAVRKWLANANIDRWTDGKLSWWHWYTISQKELDLLFLDYEWMYKTGSYISLNEWVCKIRFYYCCTINTVLYKYLIFKINLMLSALSNFHINRRKRRLILKKRSPRVLDPCLYFSINY